MSCSNGTIGDCNCCKNELMLDKLCVKKIRADELKLKDSFCAKDISTPKICSGLVISNEIDANLAIISTLNVNSECVQNSNIINAGISNLIANNACISGQLQASNTLFGNKYRATSVYSTLTTYVLGSFINFDSILDDPNNNMTVAPTTYTAPVSGYYIVSFKFNIQNLVPNAGFGPILGVPVANPQIYVNGTLDREMLSAFLSFFQDQRTILTALISLNAGDLVQIKYDIIAMTQLSGALPVPGTVDITGNGTEINKSSLKIHLLSANQNQPSCQPVFPCAPIMPQQCVPCNQSSDNTCMC